MLYPVDRSAINRRLVINDADSSLDPGEGTADMNSPRQQLRLSILKVISPPEPSSLNQTQNKARKRVQHKSGEILTREEALNRLEVEASEREAKKSKGSVEEPASKSKNKKGRKKVTNNLDEAFMNWHRGNVDLDENLNSEKENIQPQSEGGIEDLVEGESFVIVQYEGSYFPGRVVALGKNSITVSCMVKSGITTWKWPASEDIHKYNPKDVIKSIKTPEQCNSRGSFTVPEAEEYWE